MAQGKQRGIDFNHMDVAAYSRSKEAVTAFLRAESSWQILRLVVAVPRSFASTGQKT